MHTVLSPECRSLFGPGRPSETRSAHLEQTPESAELRQVQQYAYWDCQLIRMQTHKRLQNYSLLQSVLKVKTCQAQKKHQSLYDQDSVDRFMQNPIWRLQMTIWFFQDFKSSLVDAMLNTFLLLFCEFFKATEVVKNLKKIVPII